VLVRSSNQEINKKQSDTLNSKPTQRNVNIGYCSTTECKQIFSEKLCKQTNKRTDIFELQRKILRQGILEDGRKLKAHSFYA